MENLLKMHKITKTLRAIKALESQQPLIAPEVWELARDALNKQLANALAFACQETQIILDNPSTQVIGDGWVALKFAQKPCSVQVVVIIPTQFVLVDVSVDNGKVVNVWVSDLTPKNFYGVVTQNPDLTTQ